MIKMYTCLRMPKLFCVDCNVTGYYRMVCLYQSLTWVLLLQVKVYHADVPVSTIAFNPILMAPPTDHNTIYTTLLRNKEIVNSLGQEHLPFTFDMGILTAMLSYQDSVTVCFSTSKYFDIKLCVTLYIYKNCDWWWCFLMKTVFSAW